MTKSNKPKSSLLESTNLSQADFDPMMNTLTIGFVNGTVYEYYGVPEETYQNLLDASSPGKFFLSQIKGKYDFAKRGHLIKHKQD